MTNHSTRSLKLLGVIGGAASGKDTVASMFTDYEFEHVSSSDIVREEIARRGLVTSRSLQTSIANEFRREYGPGYWMDRSIERLGVSAVRGVISGIYSPSEGDYLIGNPRADLVSVVADDDLTKRFNRLQNRGSGARDNLSFDDFVAAHERENSGSAYYDTNLARLHGMARFVIHNTAGLDYLREQVEQIVTALKEENK